MSTRKSDSVRDALSESGPCSYPSFCELRLPQSFPLNNNNDEKAYPSTEFRIGVRASYPSDKLRDRFEVVLSTSAAPDAL